MNPAVCQDRSRFSHDPVPALSIDKSMDLGAGRDQRAVDGAWRVPGACASHRGIDPDPAWSSVNSLQTFLSLARSFAF